MREILFRGKRVDNGEWLYGIPIKTHIGTFIVYEENPHYCGQYGYMEICELAKVDPDTIGEYTGLTDKNGKRIFEGDIIYTPRDGGRTYVVIFDDDLCFFVGRDYESNIFVTFEGDGERYEVIGNIHDNPEMLEV